MSNEVDSAQFANMYIERVLNEVGELNKVKLMNETRILFLEKVNAEQARQLESLMQTIENMRAEKSTKKLNKSNKEADITAQTF